MYNYLEDLALKNGIVPMEFFIVMYESMLQGKKFTVKEIGIDCLTDEIKSLPSGVYPYRFTKGKELISQVNVHIETIKIGIPFSYIEGKAV
jgi:hypothetical protein